MPKAKQTTQRGRTTTSARVESGRRSTDTGSKKTRKSTPSPSSKNKNNKEMDLAAEICGVLLFSAGIFMFLVMVNALTGLAGEALQPVLFGLFGLAAYVAPLVIAALGIVCIMSGLKSIRRWAALGYLAMALCLLAFLQMFSVSHYDPSSYKYFIHSGYDYAQNAHRGCGAVANIFLYPVYRYLGAAGGYLVFLALLVIFAVVNFHFSLRRTGKQIAMAGEKAVKAGSRAVERGAEAAAERHRAKKEAARRSRPSVILNETALRADESTDDYDDLDILNDGAFTDAMQNQSRETVDLQKTQPFVPAAAAQADPGSVSENGIEQPAEIVSEQKSNPGQPVKSISEPEEKPISIVFEPEPIRREPTIGPELAEEEPEPEGDETSEITIFDETTQRNPDDEQVVSLVAPDTEEDQADTRMEYVPPTTDLLDEVNKKKNRLTTEDYLSGARKLEETLMSFGVKCTVINVSIGPAITRYELQPAPGVKISRIVSLVNDIALSMAAAGVRIEAPIPGKAAIGVEIPNATRSMVKLREVLEDSEFANATSPLTFGLGKDIAGKSVVADVAKMPHTLIAGATGSGKSVCINSLIVSILFRATPQQVRMIMIDPKVVELRPYNGIPHLLIPVVTDPKKAAGALNWAVQEMQRRYGLFAETGARDVTRYNELAEKDPQMEHLPLIVIIIDELADLMMVAPNDVEDSICRIAQLARAAGMHLVVATQRPSVDVITGIIKANIPSRIAFAVSSQVDSRTILDMAGAEKLLGKGDMLFHPSGALKPMRIQGSFVTDDEVERVVEFIKQQAEEAEYDESVLKDVDSYEFSSGKGKKKGAAEEEEMISSHVLDPLAADAVDVIYDTGQASASMLQRRLRLGYARASRLVDELEAMGIIGPAMGSKPREVLVSRNEAKERVENNAG